MDVQQRERFIQVVREAWQKHDLYQIFYEAWKSVGASQRRARSEFLALNGRYSEPHRRYHVWQHVIDGLGLIIEHADLIPQPPVVILAYFYHDAVYDVKGNYNEEQSALLCRTILEHAGAYILETALTIQLIRYTTHEFDGLQPTVNQRCIVSIDLAPLGASPEVFARNTELLAEEYGMKLEEFSKKQAAFLEKLSKRKRIFTFQPLEHFEAPARANILSLFSPQLQTAAI